MNVLVLNSGSSSIKYELFDKKDLGVRASGIVEKIGEERSFLTHRAFTPSGERIERREEVEVPDHDSALETILKVLVDENHGVIRDKRNVAAVGHRVVHGGETFHDTTVIDDRVIRGIRENIRLAPLHNPPNLEGIEIARKIFPHAIQVAVFDTAFHHTIPEEAYIYAIPYELYEKYGIRRYGFHGTSHCYVAEVAARYLGKPLEALNLITVHLGNGASITAIRNGRSIDTSMGMTPLEGLVMGTRCGDIDPALPFYISGRLGMAFDRIESLLNRQSGLRGLCGTNDMRSVVEGYRKGDKRASLALRVYCYRIKKYIGAYLAVLGKLDAIVFTAGIGENSPEVRSLACEGLEHLGISVDENKNALKTDGVHEINPAEGDVRVLVVPTNEELKIAIETVRVLEQAKKPGTSRYSPGE